MMEKKFKIPEVTERNFAKEEHYAQERLLPCPFCGNEEIDFAMVHPWAAGKPNEDYWLYWSVSCSNCGASMEYARLTDQTWDDAREDIINAWNRRANK